MSVNKNVAMQVDPLTPSEAILREDARNRYSSDTYQKVLDYHVAEILLSTIVLAVIALLRIYH
jgi:hypothetical protein